MNECRKEDIYHQRIDLKIKTRQWQGKWNIQLQIIRKRQVNKANRRTGYNFFTKCA